MPLVIADRVLETTTTTGNGTVTLAGAETGYQSFSVVGNGNTTYYTIAVDGGTDWEVGIGTYTASGTTLSRDTVLSSSNSGNLVSFGAGTKKVFVTYPAERAVYYEAAGGVVVTDNSSNNALRITQTGAGNALVVEDSANPDATPFVVDASGNVGISAAPVASKGTLQVGTIGYTGSNILSAFSSSVNGYNQVISQNTNSGASASSDFVVSNNLSTDSTYYGDFGINSSGWAGSGPLTTANNVYLTATTSDLAIGTTTANNILFATNGDNERFRIGSSGQLGVGGANYGTSGQTLTSRGSAAAPVWSNPGIISALVFGL